MGVGRSELDTVSDGDHPRRTRKAALAEGVSVIRTVVTDFRRSYAEILWTVGC